MNLELVRHAYMSEVATLGYLRAGALNLATIEDPWRPDPDGPGGQRREGKLLESCVPEGVYQLVPHDGTQFKGVWCLVNPDLGVYRWPSDIPAGQKHGRSTCLIHGGNTADAVMGCIAVGLKHRIRNNKPWITDSQVALSRLRMVLGRGTHTLTIRSTNGTNEAIAA